MACVAGRRQQLEGRIIIKAALVSPAVNCASFSEGDRISSIQLVSDITT